MSKITIAENFIKRNLKDLLHQYQPRLIGKKATLIKNINVDYYVQGTATLDDCSNYEVHYRWSTQEEDAAKRELDERYYSMQEFYEKNIVGKEITSIELVVEREGVYLFAYVSNSQNALEIPIYST